MTQFLVFLRAINLGARRKFPKDAIVAATQAAGFTGVATHINTGNVLLSTDLGDREAVEGALEAAYLADRGFEVPCIAFEAREFADLARRAVELSEERPGLERHYVYLLKEAPSADVVAAVEATSSDVGEMVVEGRAAHALLGPGYQDGKVDPLNAAKLLGVATNRNLNVVRTLAQKWCGPTS
ncbi:MAG: DUF1697 domain-containing protein [Nocardioides sp.]|uniref:DUF1697 domain-containing protein n=1 Tax=Nocardioides sp. TaxID=35761 RepID=UPI003F00E62F